MAMNIAGQLLEFGEVKRGLLGVSIQTLTPDLAKAFDTGRDHGVVITMVAPGSAAERAGLEVGDIVLTINGRVTRTVADMRNFIGLLRAGSEITLEVLRGARKMEVTAVIEEKQARVTEGDKLDRRLGGTLLKITETDDGDVVLVEKIRSDSSSYRHGLRKGDVILEVNRRRVENFNEFREALKLGRTILLRLERDGHGLFLALK